MEYILNLSIFKSLLFRCITLELMDFMASVLFVRIIFAFGKEL